MTSDFQTEYALLYQRLGLTPEATQRMLEMYLLTDNIYAEIPTLEECERISKGKEVYNYDFNNFLEFLDKEITEYADKVLEKYKRRDYIRLLTCDNSKELWEYHENMQRCPVEIHHTIVNRVIILAKSKGINIRLDSVRNEEHEEYDSWGNTNKLALPIKEYISSFLKEKERQEEYRNNDYDNYEDWTLSS